MEVKNLPLKNGIRPIEYEHFCNELRQIEFDCANFELSAVDDYPELGLDFARRTVTAKSKKTGLVRAYDANGNGTNWVLACTEDLQKGEFSL